MRKMGEESRRMAERDYDVNKVAATHLNIYEQLMRTQCAL